LAGIKKYSNMKFHENPSSGSHIFPCRQTDEQKDRQTDMTFHNFVKAPKNDIPISNN